MRERLARAALWAYPRRVRLPKGEEIVGTLLDASGRSNAAFARELVGLVIGGLRVRGLAPARPTARRVIADGCCYAGLGMIAFFVAGDLGTLLRGYAAHASPTWFRELALLGGALIVGLAGHDRLAALGAFAYLANLAPHWTSRDIGTVVLTLAIPALCFAVMLVMPRRQPRRMPGLLWLAPIVALGVLGVRPLATLDLVVPLAVLTPYALVRIRRDPRPAIACSLFAAEIAIVLIAESQHHLAPPLLILMLSTAPLVLWYTTRHIHPHEQTEAT
jgi:hypothetical protein